MVPAVCYLRSKAANGKKDNLKRVITAVTPPPKKRFPLKQKHSLRKAPTRTGADAIGGKQGHARPQQKRKSKREREKVKR
jgi:hypothetical protein